MLAPDLYVQFSDRRLTRQQFIDRITSYPPGITLTRFDASVLTVEPNGDDWVLLMKWASRTDNSQAGHAVMTSDRREPCRACDGSLWSSAPAADGSLRRQKKGAGEQGFRLVRRRLAFRSSGHPIQNRTSGSAAPARTEDGQLPTRGRRKYPAASRPVWRSRALAGTGVNGRKTEIETEPLSRKVIISFLLSEFMLFWAIIPDLT